MRRLVILMLCAFQLAAFAQTDMEMADFNIVPLPDAITPVKGVQTMPFDHIECICYGVNDERMIRNAHLLASYIEQRTGTLLPVQMDVSPMVPAILLSLNKKMTAPEGYVVEVGKKAIRIEGATPAGVFYGIQALRKALPNAPADHIAIPAVRVSATPRFAYRGLHLDVCRHFFGVEFVKECIDIMALHGLNTLHWHISDDQGWRFEVPAYPRLTEVGAWREGTVIGRNTQLYDHVRHGGFFTEEQIRDIVSYAQERYITVIPEVDMPGHMTAALAAYPNLGCTGGPYQVEQNWGIFKEVLCPGNEDTYRFVFAVIDRLAELFPSEYIHIGGDESPRDRWRACNRCQATIARENLTTTAHTQAEDLLQGYFTRRVEQYVKSKGKRIIGWDELIDCEVDASATIMNWRSWRGTEDVNRAAERGHDIIKVPNDPLYLDYYQTPDSVWSRPLLIGGYCPLNKVYEYEPAPDDLSPQARQHILGVQANLWTEYITSKELAEYQLMPRIAALAEVQWVQPAQKDFAAFKSRLPRLLALYRLNGWKYCDFAL